MVTSACAGGPLRAVRTMIVRLLRRRRNRTFLVVLLQLGDLRCRDAKPACASTSAADQRHRRETRGAETEDGFSQNFFCFSAQGSAMPAASNRRRPAFTRSASPSLR